MARLEQAAASAGTLGGKAAGAGAGGSMFFIMQGTARDAAPALSAAGATVLPLTWSREGVRAW
jgi:galactokinase/mevalonate kinase-like predicted kinase